MPKPTAKRKDDPLHIPPFLRVVADNDPKRMAHLAGLPAPKHQLAPRKADQLVCRPAVADPDAGMGRSFDDREARALKIKAALAGAGAQLNRKQLLAATGLGAAELESGLRHACGTRRLVQKVKGSIRFCLWGEEATTKKLKQPEASRTDTAPRALRKPGGAVDEFGLAVGSRTSQAAAYFKRGGTMAGCKAEVGDTFYNLLKKLEAAGHTVSREGKNITLTPKNQ